MPRLGEKCPRSFNHQLKIGCLFEQKEKDFSDQRWKKFCNFCKTFTCLTLLIFIFWLLNDLDNCLYSACEKKILHVKKKERYASLCMPLLHYFIILYCILSSVLYVCWHEHCVSLFFMFFEGHHNQHIVNSIKSI